MSIDLLLAFPSKPAELQRLMTSQAFTLKGVSASPIAPHVSIHSYYHHDPDVSVRGVHFIFHDGVYEDTRDEWKRIIDSPDEIVATGTVATDMGRSAYDLRKQWATARFLRDYYGAALYDPQHNRIVAD